jgi:hypothetical protein
MLEAATAERQPWLADRLVRWWDMLSFSGSRFLWCGKALSAIKLDCYIGCVACLDEKAGFVVIKPIDKDARENAIEKLTPIDAEFRKIGMEVTADTIKALIESLREDSKPRNFQWLLDQIAAVERLTERELRTKTFFYIYPEHAQFFPTQRNPYPLGEDVFNKFPSCVYDTNEATWCLALSRSTASVFHLMRILEAGLSALGKKFGVSLAHKNWAPALDEIEKKIRNIHTDPNWQALPDCKKQQEFYSQAASHFGILKDAWRNYTAHARGKYTQAEAEDIFRNVRGFMQKLATQLHE